MGGPKPTPDGRLLEMDTWLGLLPGEDVAIVQAEVDYWDANDP